MQTLKTAAIVVLLMTVIYGAYVSLTTPPEPLPPDVEDMLVVNDDGSLGLESVLPPSLGELEINSGIVGGTPEIVQPAESIAASLMQPEALASPFAATDTSAYSKKSSELAGPAVMPATGTPINNASFSLSDSAKAMPSDSMQLGGPTGEAVAATTDKYPNTNRTFETPDPVSAQSSFDPSKGQRFASASSDEGVKQATAINSKAGQSPNLGLVNAIQIADRQYAKDQLKDALATLSIFYSTPNLSGEERGELVSRLDPLAADVIYSRRHLLESAHRVGQNETLIEIASRYDVPWQLLANINQIQDPLTIIPGTELKVVRGPFRAEVDLTLRELTLFLGDMYAGRFPIGVGNDPIPKPGTFTVQDKQTSRTFYDAAGSPVPPGSLDNPYGAAWIDLGGQLCIHGSPSTTNPTDKGCISLAADYADDLYAILSQGSSVTIRK